MTHSGSGEVGQLSAANSYLQDPFSPPALRAAVVKLDPHMDALNKDSILGATCHWIVEIGELDSAMRRDVARLKGVLTRDSDKVRKPYARSETMAPLPTGARVL